MSDLIDRQAIFKKVEKIRQGLQMMDDTRRASLIMNGLYLCEKEVRNLPSAQPEQRWIPCSERLPDELEEVNVTWVNHKPEPYYDFVKDKPFTASAVYYKDDWYWYSSVCTDLLAECGKNEIDKIDDAIEITAWMPLPEPYKAERREE